ncbi:BCCT family transporter [Halomonas ramblicola]|nr:BCCT family transporter [Halomonas ramblicola]MDN3523044.1 BCCT family transporter [Halomonas ramblicola]
MHQELNAAGGPGNAGIIELVNAWNLPAALFVTSSDSGTLVLTTILSLGNEEPPQRFRVFWGVVIGLVAAVLLVAGGLNTRWR